MDLKGVIFDLDGVLVNTAHFHYLAWKRLADEYGIPFDEAANERFKGVSRTDCVRMLFPERDHAELELLADRKNDCFKKMIETLQPADMFPGALKFIHSLRLAGVRTAIASASRNTSRIVTRLRIGGYFDAIVDGNDVNRSKPAPDGFLLAAERMALAPNSCVVIEDAAAGIEAAHAAGMRAVGIGSPATLGEAERVVPHTGELTMELLRDL